MGIDWQSVKRDFEESCVSVCELGRRYGCDESTIRKKARLLGWARPPQPPRGAEEDGPRPESVLDDHRSLWKGVKKRLVKGLGSDDAKLGLEELKVAKIAGEVLSSVIRGERLAWGIEDGPGCDDERKYAGEIAGEMERATAPGGADEALEGE